MARSAPRGPGSPSPPPPPRQLPGRGACPAPKRQVAQGLVIALTQCLRPVPEQVLTEREVLEDSARHQQCQQQADGEDRESGPEAHRCVLRWLGAGSDAVPDPPDGLDQLPILVPELLSQVADVDLDVVLIAVEVVAPDLVQDPLPGQDLVGVLHQQLEQVEFPRRQLDGSLPKMDLASAVVENQLAHSQGLAAGAAPPPPDGLSPRQQPSQPIAVHQT